MDVCRYVYIKFSATRDILLCRHSSIGYLLPSTATHRRRRTDAHQKDLTQPHGDRKSSEPYMTHEELGQILLVDKRELF